MEKNKNKESAFPEISVVTLGFDKTTFRIVMRGLITTLPIIIILFILSLAFRLVLNMISPLSRLLNPGTGEPIWISHVTAVLLLIFFFYMVGVAVRSKKGKAYFKWFEKRYLAQIPLYNTIRELVRQFTGLKEMPFKQVVLIDPFDSGVLMTGFITESLRGNLYTVFVPTAPNPTNGNIYHVPGSRVKFLNVSPEDAMRTIVGAGTGSSCLFTNGELCEEIDITDKPVQMPKVS